MSSQNAFPEAGKTISVSCVRVDAPAQLAERVAALLEWVGGIAGYVKPGDTVFIKPNLVAPFPMAVTDLQFVACVVRAVQACGGKAVLGESAGFEFDTAATLRVVGAYDLAESLNVPLLNLDTESFQAMPGAFPLGDLRIARAACEADVLINLPKLKFHSLTTITGALKNLLGLADRATRRKLHAWDIHRGIVALNHAIRPHLTLVEGLVTLSRAVYGQARPLGVLLGAPDSLALDRLGCRLLGVPEIEVAHIRYARQENPSAVYRVIGDEPPLAQTAVKPGAIKERAHQALIHAAYLADVPYAALTGQSLLPRLHFELGVKPFLVASKCTECGACAPICPAAAIDLPGKRIIRERCEKLRCLRCIPVCPTQAIEVRGWRRPKR